MGGRSRGWVRRRFGRGLSWRFLSRLHISLFCQSAGFESSLFSGGLFCHRLFLLLGRLLTLRLGSAGAGGSRSKGRVRRQSGVDHQRLPVWLGC